MKARLIRMSLYVISGLAIIGLAGCSLVGNGYGGWYWQMPAVPQSNSSSTLGMNQNGQANSIHARTGNQGSEGVTQG